MVHDTARRHGGEQMIQAGNEIIPLKFERALLYYPIWAPTQWELDNVPRIMLTSQEPWDPVTINDAKPEQEATRVSRMLGSALSSCPGAAMFHP